MLRLGSALLTLLLLAAPLPGVTPAALAQAPATPPPAEAFGRLPAVDGPKISPDGTHLGFITSIAGQRQLVIQPLAREQGGEPVTFAPKDLEILDFGWATDQRILIATRFTQRGLTIPGLGRYGTFRTEERRIFGVDRDGGNLRELTDPRRPGRIFASGGIFLHRLPDDPRHVLMLGRADKAGWLDVVKMDIHTGELTTWHRRQDNVMRWLVDRAAVARVGIRVKEETVTVLARRTADDRFEEVYSRTRGDGPQFLVLGFVTSDPDLLYVASTHEGPLAAIYTFSIRDRAFRERIVAHPRVDVESGLFIDGELVGALYVDEAVEKVFFNPEIQALYEAIDRALPGTREYVVHWSLSARAVLIRSEAPDRPPAYLMYDAAQNSLVPLGDSYPELRDVALSGMVAVDYAARDGLTIPAFLTLPKGRTPSKLPFVILVHGGPHSRDSLEFDWLAQFLASRGYGVLQPNFRGSDGYGAAFRKAGEGQWGKAMQDDVTDGTRWLIEQGLADAERVCIMGASYGGYAALMGAIRETGLYRCAISINGVSNLPRIWDDQRYSELKETVRASLGESRGDLRAVSPYHRAGEVSAPVLLVHATGDTVVPVVDADDMAGALRSAGKPVDLVKLEGGSHWMLDAWHRIDTLKAVEPFLARHLGR